MSDLERALREAYRAEAGAVDTALDYPGDRAPARVRRRRPVAIAASVAACAALVAGVVWGSGQIGSAPAAPAAQPYQPVHSRADVPRAVQLLPGVLSGIRTLQPVEDAALRTCLRAKGSDGPHRYQDVVAPRLPSVGLEVRSAARTGYGLDAAIRAKRAETQWSASMARRFGPTWEDAYDMALIGPVDTTWVTRTLGGEGAQMRYGGCLAQVRRAMWGPDEMARFDVGLWQQEDVAYARPDVDDPRLTSARSAWTQCLARGGAAALIERSQTRAGIPRGSNDFVGGVDVEGWTATVVNQLGRDLDPAPATIRAVLADEKKLAVIDARCVQESGLRAAMAAAAARSDRAPAHLLAQDPRLLDEVFDLDAAVRRLLAQHRLG